MALTAGAIALTFFSVLAPMIDDPAAHLFALETMATIPMEAILGDAWPAQAFEFTPTMLGPAITAEMLVLAEAEEDWLVVTMPELEVHAAPPTGADEPG